MDQQRTRKQEVSTRHNTLIAGVIPPSDKQIEDSILGALLIEPNALQEVQGLLTAEVFYHPANGLVYESILSLNKERKPVDLYTVGQKLQQTGKLSEIGGPAYLVGLTQKIGSASHIEYHAAVLAQMFAQRQMIAMAHNVQRMACEQDDLDDLFSYVEDSTNAIYNSFVPDNMTHISGVTEKALKEAEKRVADHANGISSGITTGIPDLDEMLYGGWMGSQLVIIGARPGMGKTAILLHFAKVAAEKGVPVAMFQLEMSDVQLANRLLLSECTTLSSKEFRSGNIPQSKWNELENANGKINRLPIYVDGHTGNTMNGIRRKAKKLKQQGKCGMIVIDYLQLAAVEKESKKMIREQQVAEMSRTAKLMAKELDVPVLLAAQLNRNADSPAEPKLSEIRESGAIEQDADIVAFIHRPEYYPATAGFADLSSIRPEWSAVDTKGLGMVIIAKQRDGNTGKVAFRYNYNLTKISGFTDEKEFDTQITCGFDVPDSSFDDNQPF